jgi:rubrerythrin
MSKESVAIDALRQAMVNEARTHRFYVTSAERVLDEKGKAMFAELAEEELVHVRIVRQQYEALKAGGGWTAVADFAHLDDVDITPLEFKRSSLEGRVREFSSDLDALVIAAEMENNSFAFYVEQYNKTTDPLGKSLYGSLVKAERNHFNTVMANWETLATTGVW